MPPIAIHSLIALSKREQPIIAIACGIWSAQKNWRPPVLKIAVSIRFFHVINPSGDTAWVGQSPPRPAAGRYIAVRPVLNQPAIMTPMSHRPSDEGLDVHRAGGVADARRCLPAGFTASTARLRTSFIASKRGTSNFDRRLGHAAPHRRCSDGSRALPAQEHLQVIPTFPRVFLEESHAPRSKVAPPQLPATKPPGRKQDRQHVLGAHASPGSTGGHRAGWYR